MLKLHRKELFTSLPHAVLFDTDNTLYPYEPAHDAAQLAVKDKVTGTFSIKPESFDTAFQEARCQVKARLGHTAASHSRLLYMQRMLEILGLGSQVLLALDFEQTYWRTFLSSAVLFDGVKDLLEDLRLGGIPIAIVSDLTAQIQFRKIVYLGLDHYFDYIVTSEEAGFDKPHEAPFRIAMEKLRPSGDRVWMVGDHPVNDMYGAKQELGAVTLQKLHSGVEEGTGENRPDATFHSFNDVSRLVADIRKRA